MFTAAVQHADIHTFQPDQFCGSKGCAVPKGSNTRPRGKAPGGCSKGYGPTVPASPPCETTRRTPRAAEDTLAGPEGCLVANCLTNQSCPTCLQYRAANTKLSSPRLATVRRPPVPVRMADRHQSGGRSAVGCGMDLNCRSRWEKSSHRPHAI